MNGSTAITMDTDNLKVIKLLMIGPSGAGKSARMDQYLLLQTVD
jgi:GTPase SAR1 family protein